MRELDAILPGATGRPVYDLRFRPAPDVPGQALLGAVDWAAALAWSADTLAAEPSLEVGLALGGVPGEAVLEAASDGYALRAGDPETLLAATRALAAPGLRWPRGVRRVRYRAGELALETEGGTVRLSVPEAPPWTPVAYESVGPYLPGQPGPVGPLRLEATPSVAWVLAALRYAVRLALSAEDRLPWPFLRGPAEPGPVAGVVAGDALGLRPDGTVVLPAGEAGVAILERLAALPTYPERPIAYRWRRSPRPTPVVFERTVRLPWEGERLLHRLEELLAARSDDPPLRVELFASEAPEQRTAIGERAQALVGRLVPGSASVVVRSAYKQAYHHARDVWLPALRPLRPAGLVLEVPALAETAGRLGRPWSLVPTLAPADELLAEALGLSTEAVRVELETPAPFFRCRAVDGDGRTLYEDAFRPLTTSLELAPIDPDRSTLVETGGVRLVWADGRVEDHPLPTDLEQAFLAYRDILRELLGRLADRAELPLFGRLTVRARLSEPDEDLPVPWERFSPLEELHEEVYFGTLAAFDPVCRGLSGGRLRAPGLVVPEMDAAPGEDGWLTVEMTAPGEPLAPVPDPIPVAIRAIRAADGSLRAEAPPPPAGFELPPGLVPPGLTLGTPAEVPPVPAPLEPYAAEEAWPLTAGVAARTGAVAWVEAYSYEGLAIPVALWTPAPGITSPRKRGRRRPVLLVVAGHHANEASSTVSALQLLEAVAAERPDIVLIVVPMENPDGARLHRRLRREHPHWKLHAARFNALGHEFGRDGVDSPFGEALVRPSLAAAYRPDLVVDDHGVPAHEWAQPFSGRSSPPLFPVAYTYPSGLFYGIGPGDADGRPDAEMAALWRRVTARLAADAEVVEAQARLWRRYVRLGAALASDDYPSRLVDGWPFQTTRRATGRAPGAAEPLEFVTEVADEGAPPPLFGLCVRAHLLADLAAAAFLAERPDRGRDSGG